MLISNKPTEIKFANKAAEEIFCENSEKLTFSILS